MNAATLRLDFPEFADNTAYPDGTINFWLSIAGKMLNAVRFDDMLDNATELFVAHHLVLWKRDQVAAVPGQATGLVASKSVGGVSVSYDTNSTIEEGAGHWNLTVYGSQFIKLARMFGSGGLQL